MWDAILTGGIVLAAALYAIRRLLARPSCGCGCSCSGAASANKAGKSCSTGCSCGK